MHPFSKYSGTEFISTLCIFLTEDNADKSDIPIPSARAIALIKPLSSRNMSSSSIP